MLKHIVKCLALVIYLSLPATAQQPASIQAKLTTGYTDNYLQASNKQSSAIVETNIQLNAGLKVRSFALGLSGGINETNYKANSSAVFDRNSLAAQLNWRPTRQQNLVIKLAHLNAQIAPWEGIRRNAQSSTTPNNPQLQLDEAKNNQTSLGYQYKTASEKGVVFSTEFSQHQKQYAATDSLALQNNKSTNSWNSKLGYQWRSGRHLFIQYQDRRSKFDDFDQRDNNSQIYALGFSWQITAISGITFGVGQETRALAQNNVENTSNYWSLQANWSPKSYSTFSLSSRQQQQSSEYEGQILQLNKTHAASWQHTWANGLQSSINLSQQSIEQVALKRREKKWQTAIAFSYKIARSWSTSLGYRFEDHSDSANRRNYQQNSLHLAIRYQFGGNA
ncbi:outer membrane beta-barrel protein [Catenovulum agarivorans]|nr:outer membrane beta-barrel protein [Catenovulum agarivorans]